MTQRCYAELVEALSNNQIIKLPNHQITFVPSNMHILQLCKKFPFPQKDGEVIGIWMYSKGFHFHNHRVSVLAMNTRKHFSPPELLPNDWKNVADIKSVGVNSDISYLKMFLNLFSNRCYNIERFYSKEYESHLIELLQNEKFDLVQLEGVYLSQYVPVIRKHSKAKIVLRTQNVEFEIWEREAEQNSFPKKNYLRLMARRMKQFELNMLNQYDALVPVSSRDAETFKSLGCNIPIQVCEHGVAPPSSLPKGEGNSRDHSLPLGGRDRDGASVFHLGSMDWRPNLQGLEWFLENCWKKIHDEIPNAKLFFAGRNFPEDWKQKKIDGVEMIGEVEDASSFMNSKQIMIVPLHAGSGIRVKLMEGMAMGKAIVSTSIGAEGLPVIDGKNIFIANEASDFAKRVIQLLKNPAMRNEMENEARKLAEEKFDYRVLVGELLEFYKNILSA